MGVTPEIAGVFVSRTPSGETTPRAKGAANRFAAWCGCGSPLAQPPTGRKRLSCSSACRRHRQDLTRQLRRRLIDADEWRQLVQLGVAPVADASAALDELDRQC